MNTESVVYALNASQTLLVVRTWGYKDPKTGKITGMVGDLLERRAHLGGSVLFFVRDRVGLLDYLSLTSNTYGAFIFRAPSLSYTSNIYYLPLSSTVWICTVSLVALSTVVIYVTYKHVTHRATAENTHIDIMRPSDCLLLACSTVCQMGSPHNPKKMSARISTVSIHQHKYNSIKICLKQLITTFSQ